jgi:uncharacterized Zn-finger protein
MVATSYKGETQVVQCADCDEDFTVPSKEFRSGYRDDLDRVYCPYCEEKTTIETFK